MSKLEYKPIAVQDECWNGGYGHDSKELTVLIKYAAQGAKSMYYKNDAMTFPTADYLDEYITKNNLEILPEKDFKARDSERALHLIKALNKKER